MSKALWVHSVNTGNRLELVAAHGAATPDQALEEFISRLITQQLETDTFATVVQSGRRAVHDLAGWRDPRGVAHHPSLIMGVVDGSKVCAGAVVFDAPARPSPEPDAQALLDSLGEYLLRTGHTRRVG